MIVLLQVVLIYICRRSCIFGERRLFDNMKTGRCRGLAISGWLGAFPLELLGRRTFLSLPHGLAISGCLVAFPRIGTRNFIYQHTWEQRACSCWALVRYLCFLVVFCVFLVGMVAVFFWSTLIPCCALVGRLVLLNWLKIHILRGPRFRLEGPHLGRNTWRLDAPA